MKASKRYKYGEEWENAARNTARRRRLMACGMRSIWSTAVDGTVQTGSRRHGRMHLKRGTQKTLWGIPIVDLFGPPFRDTPKRRDDE